VYDKLLKRRQSFRITLYYGTTVVYAVRPWPKRRYAAHICITYRLASWSYGRIDTCMSPVHTCYIHWCEATAVLTHAWAQYTHAIYTDVKLRPYWHMLYTLMYVTLTRASRSNVTILQYAPWRRMGERRYTPAPLILNLGIRWKWPDSFTPRPLHPQRAPSTWVGPRACLENLDREVSNQVSSVVQHVTWSQYRLRCTWSPVFQNHWSCKGKWNKR